MTSIQARVFWSFYLDCVSWRELMCVIWQCVRIDRGRLFCSVVIDRRKKHEISWQLRGVVTVSYLRELLSHNTTIFNRLAKRFITYKINIVLINIRALIDSYFWPLKDQSITNLMHKCNQQNRSSAAAVRVINLTSTAEPLKQYVCVCDSWRSTVTPRSRCECCRKSRTRLSRRKTTWGTNTARPSWLAASWRVSAGSCRDITAHSRCKPHSNVINMNPLLLHWFDKRRPVTIASLKSSVFIIQILFKCGLDSLTLQVSRPCLFFREHSHFCQDQL